MNQINNAIFSKPFLITLFWKQNNHHRHGVFIHTMKVVYQTIKNRDTKLITAALLHDIGKPVVAYQKEEDIPQGEWSFTDHEEKSYQMIKDWKFVSSYTKTVVRYHYLIRDIHKHKTKDPARYKAKKEIWERLDKELQDDLVRFLKYDDLAKK
jgi:putative nucleotidyltransferase with HDIG domain